MLVVVVALAHELPKIKVSDFSIEWCKWSNMRWHDDDRCDWHKVHEIFFAKIFELLVITHLTNIFSKLTCLSIDWILPCWFNAVFEHHKTCNLISAELIFETILKRIYKLFL